MRFYQVFYGPLTELAADELPIKARKLAAFQRPPDHEYRSVRHWCNNHKPFVSNEQDYITFETT